MQNDQAIYITPIWTGAAPKRSEERAHCATPDCGARLSQYNLDSRPFCSGCYHAYNSEMIAMITVFQERGMAWRKAIRQAEAKLRPVWFPSGGPWSRL